MAANVGDIIRITDRQTCLGQQVLNVYFYRVNDITIITGDYLGMFAASFVDIVLDEVRNLQHEDLTHDELFLENLSNGVDIQTYTEGFPLTGNQTGGDIMPPYVSWGFQLLREERNTRNGYKRIGGVPEFMVTAGVFDADPALLEAVENALGADFTSGIVTYAAPIILKHPVTVPLVSPVFSNISAGLYKAVGTQNTRKFGRGV